MYADSNALTQKTLLTYLATGQSGRLLGILHAAQRKGARRIRRRHKQSRLEDLKQIITNCRKYIRELPT